MNTSQASQHVLGIGRRPSNRANKHIRGERKDMERRICLSLAFVLRKDAIMKTNVITLIYFFLWTKKLFCDRVLEESIHYQKSQRF